MSTSVLQLDPEELKRNLAITLGTQAPQLNALRQPQVAGPGPISMPPDLSVSQPTVNAPRGTVEGDQAERSRLLSSGPGVDQISGRIKDSSFGQNHPKIAGVLGPIAQGLGKVGSLAIQMATPYGPLIPGTEEHHMALVNQANHQVGAEEGEREKEAETQASQAEVPLRQAQTAEAQANTKTPEETAADLRFKNAQSDALENPWGKTPDREPISNVDQINKGMNDRYQVLHPGVQAPAEFQLPANATKGDFDRFDKLLTGEETASGNQANRDEGMRLRQAMLALATQNAGDKNLWSVPQADGSHKVIQLRPGDVIPNGAVSMSGQSTENTKAGTADAPTVSAIRFANDYLKTGAYTGPSDEALQDQFFQMAKPSSGFRMNQAQIDQLHHMASWMDSWKGRAYHAMNGTWFAPEQRQKIVRTMNDLAKSKGINPDSLPPVGGVATAPQQQVGAQNDPLGIR